MKFYYDGQLIRTSKTHVYTHACIRKGENGYICLGCSSTRAGAEKVKIDKIRTLESAIYIYTARIEAIKAGKNGFYNIKHKWISFKGCFEGCDYVPLEEFERRLENTKASLERVKNEWMIVEVNGEA